MSTPTPSTKQTTDPTPSANILLEGWQFLSVQESLYQDQAEGHSRQGRSVSRTCAGMDLQSTLEACIQDAREFQNKLRIMK